MSQSGTPADTSAEAQRLLEDRWRVMSPTEKFRVVEQLTSMATTLARTGIRHQHPDVSDEQMRLHLISRRYGEAMAEEVRRAAGAQG